MKRPYSFLLKTSDSRYRWPYGCNLQRDLGNYTHYTAGNTITTNSSRKFSAHDPSTFVRRFKKNAINTFNQTRSQTVTRSSKGISWYYSDPQEKKRADKTRYWVLPLRLTTLFLIRSDNLCGHRLVWSVLMGDRCLALLVEIVCPNILLVMDSLFRAVEPHSLEPN